MNRQKMIDQLVNDDIQTIRKAMQENDVEYLDYILRESMGYNTMSNDDLIEELNDRTWENEE